MKNILAVIFLFLCTVTSADNYQGNSIKQMVSYQRQTDKYMNDFDVNSAITLYQKAMAIKASLTVVRNLAMCYFYCDIIKKVLKPNIYLLQIALTTKI